MERICKNCDQLLYAHKTYCSSCGAKWIEKRITMRNVAGDFADLYLGFDTRFVRTFWGLFKNPECIINGYIKGRRMAYIDAVRYLLVALFISGIYVFVLKKANIDLGEMMNGFQPPVAPVEETTEAAKQTAAMNKKIQDFSGSLATDYQAILLFATIPFLAFIGRLTFWGKRFYNFTEHCVFFMYTYSHSMIVTTPISIMVTLFYPEALMYYSFAFFPLLFLYNAYAYKRCFSMDRSQIVLRSLVSIIVATALFFAIIIVGIIIGILYATLFMEK